MDITPLVPAGRKIIQAYGDGGFRIGGERLTGPLIVFPDQVIAWEIDGFDRLADVDTWASFEGIVAAAPKIELLIIGTGPRHQMVPGWLTKQLAGVGIAAEAMATGPACRTFNLLLTEERRAAAALFPVP